MPEVAKVGTDMCARARARARKAAPWFGGLPRVKHVRWRSSTGAIQLSHADNCRKDVFNGRRGEPDLFSSVGLPPKFDHEAHARVLRGHQLAFDHKTVDVA